MESNESIKNSLFYKIVEFTLLSSLGGITFSFLTLTHGLSELKHTFFLFAILVVSALVYGIIHWHIKLNRNENDW